MYHFLNISRFYLLNFSDKQIRQMYKLKKSETLHKYKVGKAMEYKYMEQFFIIANSFRGGNNLS